MKKRIASSLSLAAFLIGLTCFSMQQECEAGEPAALEKESGLITTTNAFYNMENEILDNADVVACVDGVIEGEVEFGQDIEEPCNYGIIVMCDYIQKEFTVNGETYHMYPFCISAETIRIPIQLSNVTDASELQIVIISEPDAVVEDLYRNGEIFWNNVWASKHLWVMRYFIEGNDTKQEFATTELSEFDFSGQIGFDLLRDLENATLFCTANSGESASIAFGANGLNCEGCVVTAFCDWEQVEVIGEEKACYFAYKDGKNGYCNMTFPKAREGAAYQLIAFAVPNQFMSYEWASIRIFLNEEDVE